MKDILSKVKGKYNEKEYRQKGKKILTCILFLICVAGVFKHTTYLFRICSYNREQIVGLKEEGPLDMIYIGGSAAFMYYQPLKAWNEYGFTSYDYAADTMQAENIKYFIKEVLKTHTPEVFVIDARPFQYWLPEINEVGLRNSADSMDLTWDRMKMVHNYLSNHTLEEGTDISSFYFDIIKYHSNLDALKNPENWKYISNRAKSPNKGWYYNNSHQSYDKPTDFQTEERAVLQERCVKVLNDLLEYCKEKKLKVLFVVSPYIIKKEHQMIYNTLQDIIENNGFPFLNANEYYDKMGIDFTTDFYNIDHVTCFGAEKYTSFLSGYLDQNFDLPDHRTDPAYQQWTTDFYGFANQLEQCKQTVYQLIVEKRKGIEIKNVITSVTDPFEWCNLAQNSNFSVITAFQGQWNKLDTLNNTLTEKFGIQNLYFPDNNRYYLLSTVMGGTLTSLNMAAAYQDFTGSIGPDSNPYQVTFNEQSFVKIADKEYNIAQDGIHMFLFDHNSNCTIDTITLSADENGSLILNR